MLNRVAQTQESGTRHRPWVSKSGGERGVLKEIDKMHGGMYVWCARARAHADAPKRRLMRAHTTDSAPAQLHGALRVAEQSAAARRHTDRSSSSRG